MNALLTSLLDDIFPITVKVMVGPWNGREKNLATLQVSASTLKTGKKKVMSYKIFYALQREIAHQIAKKVKAVIHKESLVFSAKKIEKLREMLDNCNMVPEKSDEMAGSLLTMFCDIYEIDDLNDLNLELGEK